MTEKGTGSVPAAPVFSKCWTGSIFSPRALQDGTALYFPSKVEICMLEHCRFGEACVDEQYVAPVSACVALMLPF